MKYLLKAREIYTPEKILSNTGVLVEDGSITEVGINSKAEVKMINIQDYKLLPGLIDMHIHGVVGFDVMEASYHSLNEISKYLSRNGVTSFVATTVTARLERIENAVSSVAEVMRKGLDGARVLGSYVEGPYIAKEYKGAHPEEWIRDIDLEEIGGLIQKSNNTIRVMTIAPEKKKCSEAIEFLTGKGVKVSMGHTGAAYHKAITAVECGASIAVHLFNGMRGLHHRDAGMLGAALNDDRVNVELICDGVHVDIPAMQIAVRCKRMENMLLISDCTMAGGLPDGEYMLGEMKVNVKGRIARVADGSLAGSTLRLIDAVRNMVEKVGVPFEDAVKMASLNPARTLGLDKSLGSIERGKKADLIAIDDRYNVVFTMIGGEIKYCNENMGQSENVKYLWEKFKWGGENDKTEF